MKALKYILIVMTLAVSAHGQDTSLCITPADYAKGLYHKSSLMRLQAAQQLALIGEKSLPELEKALLSGQENPMWSSLEALTRIGSNSVPVLLKGVQSNNIRITELACTGLQRIGPEAKAALPALYSLLTNGNASAINSSLRAVYSIEDNTNRLRQALIPLTTNPEPSISNGASNLLHAIESKEQPNNTSEGIRQPATGLPKPSM